MDHRLGMGEHSDDIARAARASGQPVPPGCDQPSIRADLVFFVEAYDTLSTCRIGGHIPWTAVLEYARCYGVSLDNGFDFLWKVIHSMDQMELKNKKNKVDADERFKKIREKDRQAQ